MRLGRDATVSQQPPHLKAAMPFSAGWPLAGGNPLHTAASRIFFVWWWAMVRRRILEQARSVVELLRPLADRCGGGTAGAGRAGLAEFMGHETLDELWRSRRWDGQYDFDVPCLHVTGWHDREDITGAFHHYEEMIAHSPAPQWLLVGPWSHVSSPLALPALCRRPFPDASLDMTAIELRFFDHFLKGEDNGVEEEPRVRITTRAPAWQTRPGWKGDTRELELFLGSDRKLLEQGGAEGEDSYRYDPMNPDGLRFPIEDLPLEPPLDLGEFEEQDGVIGWTGEPLGKDVTVRGWGELEVWAASDREDTEWYAKIADVDPDGKCLWVGWGCLRASFGEDPEAGGADPG